MDLLVLTVLLEVLVLMDQLDHLDCLVNLEIREVMDQLETLVLLESPADL